MTFTTKYNIGDGIWAMIENRPVEKTVEAIEVRQSISRKGNVILAPRVTYLVSSKIYEGDGMRRLIGVPEDLVATSKEELLAQL